MTGAERDVLGRSLGSPDRTGRPGEVSLLAALLRILRRYWPLVVGAGVLLGVVGYVMASREPKVYESSATLLFRAPEAETALYNVPDEDQLRSALTNLELGALDVVSASTARRLRGSGLSAAEVNAGVQVNAGRDSDVATVRAEAEEEPQLAADLANAFASEYVAFRRRIDRARVLQAQRGVQQQLDRLPSGRRQGREARNLRGQLQQLEVLAALRTGNVQLVDRASASTSPIAPRPNRQAAVGVLAGILLALAIAVVLEQFDRRLRDEGELDDSLGLPVLTRVPRSRDLEGPLRDLGVGPDGEAFRMLRANLRALDRHGAKRSVLVTSALPGEGKTTVAWGLALAEARASARVLLVEADLRRPRIAEGLLLTQRSGLSQVLDGEVDLDDAIVEVVTSDVEFEVLPAGPATSRAAELLESQAMRELLAVVVDRYDLVILDTPPLNIVSDTTPLLGLVGGTILVTRLGVTTSGVTREVKEALHRGNANVLGVVLNGGRVSREASSGYYAYAGR